MITLHLSGQLAKDYGETLTFEASTPREAVTALSYQCPKYRDTLTSNDWHIFVGEENDISESELDLNLGRVTDVYLLPRIEGSSGAFNFIVGAALTIVGVFSGMNPALIGAGIGMMIGGLVQMTTKMPGVSDMSRDSVDDKASFLFSGPTNTATQGVAIPRGYGRSMVGSTVVSVALYAEQLKNHSSQALTTWPSLKVGALL